MSIQTHKLADGTFVVSEYECWLPGCFESEATATAAVKLSPDVLASLAAAGDVITLAQVEAV